MPSMCLARERESAEKLFSAKARQLLRALVIARLRRKWFLKRPPRASGEAARMIGGFVQQAERQTPNPPIFRAIMPSRDCSRSEVTFLVCRPSRTTPSIKHRAIFRAYFFEFAEAKRVTLMSSCGAEKLGRLNSSCGAERGRLISSVLHTQIRLCENCWSTQLVVWRRRWSTHVVGSAYANSTPHNNKGTCRTIRHVPSASCRASLEVVVFNSTL